MTGEKKKRNKERKRGGEDRMGISDAKTKKTGPIPKIHPNTLLAMEGGSLEVEQIHSLLRFGGGSRPALNPNGRYTQLYSVLCIPGGDTYHDLVGDQVICI